MTTIDLTPTTTATTTVTTTLVAPYAEAPIEWTPFDLYRDIHKGIRSLLADLVTRSAAVDPADAGARDELARQVADVAWVLEQHAHHEDDVIDPVLQRLLPGLAAELVTDHEDLERRFVGIVDLAQQASTTRTAARERGNELSLELAAFTGRYFLHQDVEERVVMPALARELSFEQLLGLNDAIVSSIAPDDMARSLSFMLPAMNAADQIDMLQGMRQSAPPEVVEGVLALAHSVLTPERAARLVAGLGS